MMDKTMEKIRCLFADDEPLMRDRMRDLLALHAEHFEVVAEAVNGQDALDKFQETEPDVCFLDIRMPVLSGLEVASEIGEKAKIVLCTAYDQFAIEAFERGVVDYLLKPIEEDRLAVTLHRLRNTIDESPQDLVNGLDPELFWQVHRGAIVNVQRISKITRDGVEKHSLVLRGSNEKISVSRHFFQLFKQM